MFNSMSDNHTIFNTIVVCEEKEHITPFCFGQMCYTFICIITLLCNAHKAKSYSLHNLNDIEANIHMEFI